MQNKGKNKISVIKRISSAFLSAVVSFTFLCSLGPMQIYADSNDKRRAMIQYFENRGAEGIADNITDADMRLFGIFLSNFYTPYSTNLTDEAQVHDMVLNVVSFLMGYDSATSMSSANKEVAEQFATNMYSSINNNKVQLFMGDNYKGYWNEWITEKYTTLHDSSNNVFFSLRTDDKSSTFCGYATWLTALAGGENFSTYITTLKDAAKEDTDRYSLFITPFGDIIDKEGTVIIPGCVNPYTFTADGTRLPLNNSFSMGSFLGGTSLDTGKEGIKYLPYFSRELYDRMTSLSEESALHIFGLRTQNPIDKRVSDYSTPNNNTFNSELPYYYLCLVPDANSILNTDGFWEKLYGKGANTTTNNLKDMCRPIYIAEADLETDVLQSVYVLGDKNAYGGYDYSNAQEARFFSSTSSDVNSYNNNTIVSPVRQAVVKDGITDDNYKKDAENAYKELYLFVPIRGNCFNSKAYIEMSVVARRPVEKDSYACYSKDELSENYKSAYVQMYNYEILCANGGIGDALNRKNEVMGSVVVANKVNMWAEIFYAYMMLYNDINPNLPPVIIDGIQDLMQNIDGAQTEDEINRENAELANKALKQIEDLLSDDYNAAKGNLIANWFESFFLKIHRQMLGLKSTDIAHVSNTDMQFSGFTSPVTIPSLSELPLTANILKYYKHVYAVLLAVAAVLLVLYLLLRLYDIKTAVATFLVLAFCLTLPQTLLDSVVQLTNTAATAMFSDRFTYWALLQHQQYLQRTEGTEDDEMSDADQSSALLSGAMSKASDYYTTADGVQLKWMSPKKGNSFTELNSNTVEEDTIPGLNTFKWLFTGYLNQESYSTDALATYLFRTYSSLAEGANMNYNAIKGKTGTISKPNNIPMIDTTGAKSSGYRPQKTNYYRIVPLSNTQVGTAMNSANISLTSTGNDPVGLNIGTDVSESLAAWLYYSESPFYYFYCALKEAMGEDEGFLSNFLSEEVYESTTQDQTYGALQDFLDVEGLFTYVIPYMEGCNEYVDAWVTKYGVTASNYKGSLADASGALDAAKSNTLNSVWNLYCPWVDALTDLKYSKTTISVMGKNFAVTDTFNPATYKNEELGLGRSMIFSEAQRINNGVSSEDLTITEQKLLKFLDTTYEDFRYLANYANFDDEAIITAAAMIATFNFNKTFSATSVTGEAVELYPQGFELRTFNYDAFLRLILLNNSGISVMSTSDIYETVVTTEVFGGILLVVNDLITVLLVPAIKVLFLIITFALSFVFMLLIIYQKPAKVLNLTLKVVVLPAAGYGVVTLAYSVLTAILMGSGLSNYVGDKTGSLTTNSPSITLLILIVIGIALIVSYGKLLILQIKSIRVYGSALASGLMDIGSNLVDGIKNRMGRFRDRAKKHSEAANKHRNNVNKEDSKKGDNQKGDSQKPANDKSDKAQDSTSGDVTEIVATQEVEASLDAAENSVDRQGWDNYFAELDEKASNQTKDEQLNSVAYKDTDSKTDMESVKIALDETAASAILSSNSKQKNNTNSMDDLPAEELAAADTEQLEDLNTKEAVQNPQASMGVLKNASKKQVKVAHKAEDKQEKKSRHEIKMLQQMDGISSKQIRELTAAGEERLELKRNGIKHDSNKKIPLYNYDMDSISVEDLTTSLDAPKSAVNSNEVEVRAGKYNK